jgi:hypothetical protein
MVSTAVSRELRRAAPRRAAPRRACACMKPCNGDRQPLARAPAKIQHFAHKAPFVKRIEVESFSSSLLSSSLPSRFRSGSGSGSGSGSSSWSRLDSP